MNDQKQGQFLLWNPTKGFVKDEDEKALNDRGEARSFTPEITEAKSYGRRTAASVVFGQYPLGSIYHIPVGPSGKAMFRELVEKLAPTAEVEEEATTTPAAPKGKGK